MANALFVGAGYVARAAIAPLQAAGFSISATVRTDHQRHEMAALGVAPYEWEAPSPMPDAALASAEVILVSVPPPRDDQGPGCPACAAFADAVMPAGTHIIYLSSSGVYGDHDGAWVDEDTLCRPTSGRGRRRLAAEQAWTAYTAGTGARLSILRLAGIYGPGRNAVASLLGGTRGQAAGLSQRVIKPGQVFNRIHRDDIVSGVLRLCQTNETPGLINFADDEPCPPQDVIAYAASLLGRKPPPEVPFDEADLSAMARSFYQDNKRLRNSRLKGLLGGTLKFPSYRDGLENIYASIEDSR